MQMKLVFLILGFFECVCNAWLMRKAFVTPQTVFLILKCVCTWLMRKAFVTPQTEKYTVVLSVLQGHLKHSHENRYLRRGLYIGSAILNGKFKFNVFSKGLKILSDISLYRKYSLYFVIMK
jgi:hypothetical protein